MHLFYRRLCMKLIQTCIALSLAGAVSSATITAQQAAPPAGEQARAQAPEPVTGEILSVDEKARTIVVKTTTDTEMKFSYSAETQIVGGEKGPEGLATSAGNLITVTYGVHGTTNVAVKIEVKPKK
ncbi:MAG: hypothetical protein ABI024_06930 [Vicinamibacterales bacterium]